jgi:hypothetical protein
VLQLFIEILSTIIADETELNKSLKIYNEISSYVCNNDEKIDEKAEI